MPSSRRSVSPRSSPSSRTSSRRGLWGSGAIAGDRLHTVSEKRSTMTSENSAMQDARTHPAVVGAEGHLIDSNILNAIFDKVIERGGAFEVENFTIGRTNDEISRISLKVSAPTAAALRRLVEDLMQLGCSPVQEQDALIRTADRDGSVPDDFYSTTNLRTHVRVSGDWTEVERQRMDAVVLISDGRAFCRKLREVRAGDQ